MKKFLLQSELNKKRPSTKKALEHFDDFYDSVYGESWKHIRSALLSEDHKYVAIINNFSNTDRIREELEVKVFDILVTFFILKFLTHSFTFSLKVQWT